MTLNLSFLGGFQGNGTAIQVTDRLVSTIHPTSGVARPYDRYANKNVVYCPRNGIVSIGYTGLAEIAGLPTDEWIAQVLWREPVPHDRGSVVFRNRPDLVESLGQGIQRLVGEFERQYSRVGSRRAPIYLVIVGWQRTRRSNRLRPVAWTVYSDGLDLRTFRWEREPRGRLVGVSGLRADPRALTQQEWERTAAAVWQAPTAEVVEDILAMAIWWVSQRTDRVGASSTVIRLTPSVGPQVRLRFVPVGDNVIGHLGTDGTTVHPITFSPFVVMSNCLMLPAATTGGATEVSSGGVSVKVEPLPGSPAAFYRSQPRRLSPHDLADRLQQPTIPPEQRTAE